MSLANSCRFLGRLGAQPDMQYTPGGTAIVKVGLAVKGRRKKGDEWIDQTTWVNITAFARQAETMNQIANKGDLIQVETEYQTSKYEDEDGNTRYRHDFIVRDWNLAARKGTSSGQEFDDNGDFDEEEVDEDEELPF